MVSVVRRLALSRHTKKFLVVSLHASWGISACRLLVLPCLHRFPLGTMVSFHPREFP